MKKLIAIFLFVIALSSCTFCRTHKMDIEQGNIITEENVSQLRVGMGKNEVREIMGNPVAMNIFTNDRLNYVYTFKMGYEPIIGKRVTCVFKHGRLKEIIKVNV